MTVHDSVDESEINLAALFLTLWRGKYFIALFTFFSVLLAVFYLHIAERKYDVGLLLAPTLNEGQDNPLGDLSRVASLAGFGGSGRSSSDFLVFQKLLHTEDVAAQLLLHHDLIQELYPLEWDSASSSWRAPPRGMLSKTLSYLKRIATGDEPLPYSPPDAKRLAAFLSKAVLMSQQRGEPFLQLSTRVSKPELGEKLLVSVVEIANEILRERFQRDGIASIEFYKSRLESTFQLEHRQAIIRLMSNEEQKLMMASKNAEFSAKTISGPSFSRGYVSPRPLIVLALAIVGALIFSSFIVLLVSHFRSISALKRES